MSRFGKREDDECPMSYEEFLEMRARLRREANQYAQLMREGKMSIFRLGPKDPAINRKVSRRELQYLEILESTVDDLFG